MDFIRRQRLQPGHNPNTHHVICGSDSDLILLGLATHEPRFTIMCEVCGICERMGHSAKKCHHLNELPSATSDDTENSYIFVHLSTLREYLAFELKMLNSSLFQWELERAIDDWVFLCLLLGNDFLPNSPSVGEPRYIMGHLLSVYKDTVSKFSEYLTENGIENIQLVENLLQKIGEKENDIFMKRHEAEKRRDGYDDVNDTIRLWEEDKLEKFRSQVAQHYARGLCWILQYYYQGVPSWDWYYPYHYAPFASDCSNLTDIKFDRNTQPFSPLEQMLATFPSQNAKYLPLKWQYLVLDKKSPIIEYYPEHFTVDPNGANFVSNYIALLPFVDEKRLRDALKPVYSKLTPEEEKLNKRDYDRLFIHSTNLFYKQIGEIYNNNVNRITQRNPLSISTRLSNGIGGKIWSDDNEKIIRIGEKQIVPLSNCEDIRDNQVVCVKFRDFQFPDTYIFKTKLLDFVKMPRKTLNYNDYHPKKSDQSNNGFAQQSQFQ